MKIFRKLFGTMSFLSALLFTVLLTGCGLRGEAIVKIRDLEFTVMEEDQVPKALKEVIDENLGTEMKLSYQNEGELYIARGFGEQKTGGYSIAVEQCYLGEDGIHVKFQLIGPSKEEKLAQEPSYPYIVIKTEDLEETIIFD